MEIRCVSTKRYHILFSDCDLCLALSYANLYYVIFFPQLLCKSREMRTVVGHNGRKGVELSHAKRKFLIYDVKMFV